MARQDPGPLEALLPRHVLPSDRTPSGITERSVRGAVDTATYSGGVRSARELRLLGRRDESGLREVMRKAIRAVVVLDRTTYDIL